MFGVIVPRNFGFFVRGDMSEREVPDSGLRDVRAADIDRSCVMVALNPKPFTPRLQLDDV